MDKFFHRHFRFKLGQRYVCKRRIMVVILLYFKNIICGNSKHSRILLYLIQLILISIFSYIAYLFHESIQIEFFSNSVSTPKL